MSIPFVRHRNASILLNLWIISFAQSASTLLFILSRNEKSHSTLNGIRAIVRLLVAPNFVSSILYISSIIWIIFQRKKLRSRISESFGYRWHRIIIGAIFPPTIPLFFAFDIERLKQTNQDHPINRREFRSLKTSRIGYFWFAACCLFLRFSLFNQVGNVIDYVTIGPSNMTDPIRYAIKFVDPNKMLSILDQYSKYLWLASIAYTLVLTALAFSSFLYLRCLRPDTDSEVSTIPNSNVRTKYIAPAFLGLLLSFSSINRYQSEASVIGELNAPTVTNVPKIVMVDVMCMNLQDAQDLIQDQGIFLTRSKDASGQDRNQIYDRNWIVVSQNIAVGEPIGENQIVLSVLRENEIAEDSQCFGETK